jgi:hypothetical protein
LEESDGVSGDRRQETGDRRQETGDRRQETGDRRQETGDRRQETGDLSVGFYRLMQAFSIFGVEPGT